jgi:hypothetical protein
MVKILNYRTGRFLLSNFQGLNRLKVGKKQRTMVSRKEDGIMLENLTLWQDRLSEDSPWKKDFLPLAEGQILQLHSQGNILRNSAQIFLAPGAEIKGILHSILQGPLWIFAGVSVYQSFVQESVLEEGVKISSCPLVRSSVLLRGTQLRGVEVDCPEGTDLALRKKISLGLEAGKTQLVPAS